MGGERERRRGFRFGFTELSILTAGEVILNSNVTRTWYRTCFGKIPPTVNLHINFVF